ncbi:hypothetical protein [Clostridium kluyveri]|uniref:Uncharacterized protein n=1 Tax=Clostridium kluyveri TaxID=1534 RepID=A0A1L5FB18_CLOKL|nr:hypothetical protein [Clostridium kluyveri]APM40010.1 hypothetical protein BS101_15330 [Clostridium kluyveri]UZQ49752.1 hypothetical protein OP486_17670 [Clostridium kluyveri]
MKAWILFGLFIIVGLGMFIAGIIYMKKEKNDVESVRIYRNISVIGVVVAVASIVVKFLL